MNPNEIMQAEINVEIVENINSTFFLDKKEVVITSSPTETWCYNILILLVKIGSFEEVKLFYVHILNITKVKKTNITNQIWQRRRYWSKWNFREWIWYLSIDHFSEWGTKHAECRIHPQCKRLKQECHLMQC